MARALRTASEGTIEFAVYANQFLVADTRLRSESEARELLENLLNEYWRPDRQPEE